MAVFLLIGKTSALTMNIAGVVKDWMLIGLSGESGVGRERGARRVRTRCEGPGTLEAALSTGYSGYARNYVWLGVASVACPPC